MGAYKAVAAGMQKAFCEPAQELRALELERLDRLHEALWPRAIGGDDAALDRLLRVIDRRVRLLGLDAPARGQADVRKAYDVVNSPERL